MKQTLWYGYSNRDNRVHFFNNDPGSIAEDRNLVGTGKFSIDGDVKDLNIEKVPLSAGSTSA